MAYCVPERRSYLWLLVIEKIHAPVVWAYWLEQQLHAMSVKAPMIRPLVSCMIVRVLPTPSQAECQSDAEKAEADSAW